MWPCEVRVRVVTVPPFRAFLLGRVLLYARELTISLLAISVATDKELADVLHDQINGD